jgi:hypothetical protein
MKKDKYKITLNSSYSFSAKKLKEFKDDNKCPCCGHTDVRWVGEPEPLDSCKVSADVLCQKCKMKFKESYDLSDIYMSGRDMIDAKKNSIKITVSPKAKHSEKIYIDKVMDVCIGHLTEDDRKWLKDESTLGNNPVSLVTHDYGYGYLVYARNIPSLRELSESYSKQMIDIIKTAKANDVDYIKFDRDGVLYDQWRNYG